MGEKQMIHAFVLRALKQARRLSEQVETIEPVEALRRASMNEPYLERMHAQELLRRAAVKAGRLYNHTAKDFPVLCTPVEIYNSLGHEAVLAMFDFAIEAAKEELFNQMDPYEP